MKIHKLTATALAAGMAMFASGAIAHSGGTGAGEPTCLESNIMLANAQNWPFANTALPPTAPAGSAGQVLEMNTTTGERGITVGNPFTPANLNTTICPGHVTCEVGPGGGVGGPFGDGSAPWKPTGIVSGGENGHAYLTSAAQHALIEHHRDGTPIRTSPVWPTSPSQNGGGFGFVPRLLGNGFMPNGNIAQTTCDANFFNAPNSDDDGSGGLEANHYFPPVNGTAARAANGRVIILDQVSMEVIDEYTVPKRGKYANDPRWNCPAGVIFTSEGMFVSMFHGDAVFVIDWKAGINRGSRGVGSNKTNNNNDDSDDNGDTGFVLDKRRNRSKVIRVIDLSNDGTTNGGYALNYDDSLTNFDSGHRRDNLRAIRMSEDGTLWGTRRSRDAVCGRDAGCNPNNFRQHIFAADPGSDTRSGSIGLDPGVNVIAGVTINRMSGPGCAFVQKEVTDAGGTLTGDECDVETLYVGVSADNSGCGPIGAPAASPNPCFEPRGFKGGGGALLEYRIDKAHWDATNGTCDGDPVGINTGCASPIHTFKFISDGGSIVAAGSEETLDPRMVMTIHEAFVQ